jgi:trehalose 6-phosphate phosphatase
VGSLPESLVPLVAEPDRSGLCLDFDGTLSPIVRDPATARPLPGVPALLTALAARFAMVAVISGRPLMFLQDVLGAPPGVHLAGLYGLERAGPDGSRSMADGAGPWESVIGSVAARATAEAPDGVHVEPKGFTVTLHWRNDPREETWVKEFAARAVEEHGLVSHYARQSLELGPPLAVDKGTVVRSLARGLHAVAAFGDDLGDLPAFDALTELAGEGLSVARVAVVDEESPPEVAAKADVLVQGAQGAIALLEALLAAAGD